MMKKAIIYAVFMGVISAATAKITFNVYESDGLTPFDGRNITVGTELKLIVASDANDFWAGGLFLHGENRDLAILSGSGKEPDSRDWAGSHLDSAGPEALVFRWEDSRIEGFDLFSDSNSVPGEWFVIDYTALAPGDPNVGFYEYSASWNDPNGYVTFHQVPAADFNTDGIVNLLDYSVLAFCWQADDCSDPDGCQKADLDRDGTVDVDDLLLFADDWLWGVPEPVEPNEPDPVDPLPDPNLIYQVVDADGLSEITIDIGQTVTLYVDMVTLDVNKVWAFDVEVDISDPNLGTIDNTAYDPNNPPGEGTARILADPNRWTAFDSWGPGYWQEKGIGLSGLSTGYAFEDGHLASFEFTSQGAGDMELSLINLYTTSTSGQELYPTVAGILIHQNDPYAAQSSMMLSPMSIDSMTVSEEPTYTPDELAQWLEELWEQDDGVQDMIPEEEWQDFVDSVRDAQ